MKDKKDEILAKRKEEFLKAKMDSVQRYKKELLKYIELKIEEINNSDVDELKAMRKRLKHIKSVVSGFVDEEYYDLVDELKINMSSKLKSELNSYFKSTRRDIDNAEGTKTDTWTTKEGGVFGFFQDTVHHSETYTTVRAGAVRSVLSDLTIEIENAIETVSDVTILSWRKSLTPTLIGVLRDNTDDENINPNQIRKVVRNVINRVEFPMLSYQDDVKDEDKEEESTNSNFLDILAQFIPSLGSSTGTLTGKKAEEFLDEAKDYVSSLKKRVSSDIDSYLDALMSNLKGVEISNEIFSEYDEQLEELEKQIKNKEITLDEYSKLNKAIVGINS